MSIQPYEGSKGREEQDIILYQNDITPEEAEKRAKDVRHFVRRWVSVYKHTNSIAIDHAGRGIGCKDTEHYGDCSR